MATLQDLIDYLQEASDVVDKIEGTNTYLRDQVKETGIGDPGLHPSIEGSITLIRDALAMIDRRIDYARDDRFDPEMHIPANRQRVA